MDTGKAELDRIRHELAAAAEELIKEAPYTRPGGLFVLGCSTSEVIGVAIGKGSNRDVGEAIIEACSPSSAATSSTWLSRDASTSTAPWWWNGRSCCAMTWKRST